MTLIEEEVFPHLVGELTPKEWIDKIEEQRKELLKTHRSVLEKVAYVRAELEFREHEWFALINGKTILPLRLLKLLNSVPVGIDTDWAVMVQSLKLGLDYIDKKWSETEIVLNSDFWRWHISHKVHRFPTAEIEKQLLHLLQTDYFVKDKELYEKAKELTTKVEELVYVTADLTPSIGFQYYPGQQDFRGYGADKTDIDELLNDINRMQKDIDDGINSLYL